MIQYSCAKKFEVFSLALLSGFNLAEPSTVDQALEIFFSSHKLLIMIVCCDLFPSKILVYLF